MASQNIDDVVDQLEEQVDIMVSPQGLATMSAPDQDLLVEILGNRNGYGAAGRPAGSRVVGVDSGMEDDEDDGGGLSRWYKQTDIASEMSQRTLNSIIEDADLSDPQLLELVLLLDSLARWQFHAPCNNRQQHVDALLLEVRLLDAALSFWSEEGKESAYWVPGDHAPEVMADARDGPYLRRAVSRVGLLQRYQGRARLDACRSMMETTKKHVQRIYTSWDRAIGEGVSFDYSYLLDLYAMPVDPDSSGLKNTIAPYFGQELHAVCMASVAGQRAGKRQATLARILQNFRGGGSIEEQRMSQGFFERRQREQRLTRDATTASQIGYSRTE